MAGNFINGRGHAAKSVEFLWGSRKTTSGPRSLMGKVAVKPKRIVA